MSKLARDVLLILKIQIRFIEDEKKNTYMFRSESFIPLCFSKNMNIVTRSFSAEEVNSSRVKKK